MITTGENFPDALVGAPLAKYLSASLILTHPNYLPTSIKEEIIRLDPKNIYILGGEDAVPNDVIENVTKDRIVERLSGQDRYQTALAINNVLPPPPNKTAIVATGENYPDALSVSSVAGSLGMPIFLTDNNNVYGEEIMSRMGIEKIVIVGGEDVVSKSIEEWYRSHGYYIERYAGSNRYETSLAIANWAVTLNLPSIFVTIATGENFPDALSAGPLNHILILVRDSSINPVINFLSNKETSKVQIIGGTDVVSSYVEKMISLVSKPIRISGSGQQVSNKFVLRTGLTIFTMTHDGESNFAIWLLDSQGNTIDLLVNEIGYFNGRKAVGISIEKGYILNIAADGNWTIKIEQPYPTSAENKPATFTGRGQQVSPFIQLGEGLTIFKMTHDGESNFAIWLLDINGNTIDLLVNEIGVFDGSKAIGITEPGIYILDIAADGNWTVSIE